MIVFMPWSVVSASSPVNTPIGYGTAMCHYTSGTPRGVFGPDVYKITSREYWDLTTKTDWAHGTHQARYDKLFGNGTGIFW